jgi:hypothetical protein
LVVIVVIGRRSSVSPQPDRPGPLEGEHAVAMTTGLAQDMLDMTDRAAARPAPTVGER